MVLTIITAIILFISGAICFSPYFRKIPILRPLAVFLFFQGIMQIFTFIFRETDPLNNVPFLINQIGSILILLYFIFILYMTKKKIAYF